MKKITMIFTFLFSMSLSSFATQWHGKWIVPFGAQNLPNSWYAFKKQTTIESVPTEAMAKIAVDSKYWLWINNELVVFEGGLKRGPNPTDTYYDEIDIAPFLRKGQNTIAVLVWYFGKDGFSHISSGKTGLLFDCVTPEITIVSDDTWHSWPLEAYGTCEGSLPNFRLSESNIRYDARKEISDWMNSSYDASGMRKAEVFGIVGCAPWNQLHKRNIPQFKDFGLKSYTNIEQKGDTLICELPYNCQFTPWLKVEAPEGELIKICTDNYLYYDGGDPGLRIEYITRQGIQEYENPGWINGHKVFYLLPPDVKVIDVQYRETGYNAEFEGYFHCSDEFLNRLWEKARRSLYITMRDNFMDCPDRERAQWAGDAVNQSMEAYYSLSVSSYALVRKWLYETVNWQKHDGVMFAPVPAGNWFQELPGQVLATIGKFSVWNYYLYTGDKQLLKDLYPGIKRYLDLWEPDGKGTIKFREGDWTWGDWGDNRDLVLLFNLWYYIAIQSMENIAQELGYTGDAANYTSFLSTFKQSFNEQFWNGKVYRHPGYQERTDDRVHALAVVSGIAGPDKYNAIATVFRDEQHASPYMEKYIFEAMMQMGYEKKALERHKARFSEMVFHPDFTTLFEGWGIGEEGYGGGTVNHGWSGGGLVVSSQYISGIAPVTPGYDTFSILPQPGNIEYAEIIVPTVKGQIKSKFNVLPGSFQLEATVPHATTAIIGVPFNKKYREIKMNDQIVWRAGKYIENPVCTEGERSDTHIIFQCVAGEYKIIAK